MEKRDRTRDPGWNDPPLFSYEEHAAQLKSTKPKTLLNKRVSYPLGGAKTNNVSVVDPTLPLQPCTKDTLPPPPPTSANFLNRDTVSAIPDLSKSEDKRNENEDFNTEDALSQTMANFNNILTSDSIRNKGDVEKRLEMIKKMWSEGKFTIEIQKKILQLSEVDGPCPEGAFPCINATLCIPQRFMCNNHSDCPLGDDEDKMECADLHGPFKKYGASLQTYNLSSGCILDNIPSMCACEEERTLSCKAQRLSAVPKNISLEVNRMILANNSIVLTRDSFRQYSSLTVIHLEGNGLASLPRDVFSETIELRRLLLMKNNLKVLEPCVFCSLQKLKWLFLSDNKLEELNVDTWSSLRSLDWLDLTRNRLTLADVEFPQLDSLQMLYIGHNLIETIRMETFHNLVNLADLDLRNNRIKFIHPDAFSNMKNLQDLNLSNNKLRALNENVLLHLTSLKKLFLGYNPLESVPSNLFHSLGSLKSLNLQGIEIENIDIKMFRMLQKLDFVYFKTFYYCTYAPNVPKCKPNSDGVSSFEHLLSKPIQRVTVWFVGIFTCAANTLVVWGRFTARDENLALSFVIRNLAMSDMLMGVYLIIIGWQDIKFRGIYNHHANRWMSSWSCAMTGIIAMTSSEVSVLILAFLSIERFLLIAVPFSGHHTLNMKMSKLSLLSIWFVGVVIATVPVFHWKDSTRFYGTNGLCFPLHIDEPYLMGWQYSAFVFLGINTAVLILMVFLYSGMFVSIWRTRAATTVNVGDSEFAVRFFLIVLTDAMCWAPIIAIKILAFLRVPISATLYAWVVVFILPVNSAVNPLLYTFTTPKYCGLIKHIGLRKATGNLKRSRKHLSADTDVSNTCNKRQELRLCGSINIISQKYELYKNHLTSTSDPDPYKINTFLKENV